MEKDRSAEAPFNKAADRRAHEFARLTEEERTVYLERREELQKQANAEKVQLMERQQDRREQDLVAAREAILAETRTPRLRPSSLLLRNKDGLTPERLDERAVRRVEANNAAELAKVDTRTQRQLDHELALIRFHHPEFQRERDSVEALREQKRSDRDATRVLDNAPQRNRDRGDSGRER